MTPTCLDYSANCFVQTLPHQTNHSKQVYCTIVKNMISGLHLYIKRNGEVCFLHGKVGGVIKPSHRSAASLQGGHIVHCDSSII